MPAPNSTPVLLESGDRLTRAEFHRRYCARPDIQKAELIEGVVYVASPVRAKFHGKQHAEMVAWLGLYRAYHPEVEVQDNATTYLDEDTEVQPDAFLWHPEAKEPGDPRATDDGYVAGAPRFVVEVAASSASYDLHDKLRAYLRNGVQEYVVWRVLDDAIDWFRLRAGAFVRVEPDASGVIESETFPGLRLHVAKMLAGDLRGVLAELEPPADG